MITSPSGTGWLFGDLDELFHGYRNHIEADALTRSKTSFASKRNLKKVNLNAAAGGRGNGGAKERRMKATKWKVLGRKVTDRTLTSHMCMLSLCR